MKSARGTSASFPLGLPVASTADLEKARRSPKPALHRGGTDCLLLRLVWQIGGRR
jgi:hypothetical protein